MIITCKAAVSVMEWDQMCQIASGTGASNYITQGTAHILIQTKNVEKHIYEVALYVG
jgi:hypothetical protein